MDQSTREVFNHTAIAVLFAFTLVFFTYSSIYAGSDSAFVEAQYTRLFGLAYSPWMIAQCMSFGVEGQFDCRSWSILIVPGSWSWMFLPLGPWAVWYFLRASPRTLD